MHNEAQYPSGRQPALTRLGPSARRFLWNILFVHTHERGAKSVYFSSLAINPRNSLSALLGGMSESRKRLRLRAWHDQERFQENWGRELWLTSRVNQFEDWNANAMLRSKNVPEMGVKIWLVCHCLCVEPICSGDAVGLLDRSLRHSIYPWHIDCTCSSDVQT